MGEENLDNAFEGVDGAQSNIAADESATETPAGKSWSDRGFPDSFNGMDESAVAQRVKEAIFREKQWGEQGNTIGDLKKRNQELEGLMRKGLGEEKVEEPITDIGRGEFEAFYRDLETNPRKAVLDLIKPHLGLRSDDQLKDSVSKIVNEILGQYDDYNNETRYKEANEDWSQHDPYVKLLRSEENFGPQRSYAECQKLARLVAENKSLADLVYSEMKSHPTMSFERAKKIAEYELGAKAATEKIEEVIEKQVNKVPTTGGKKQTSTDEVIKDMDDAFNVG